MYPGAKVNIVNENEIYSNLVNYASHKDRYYMNYASRKLNICSPPHFRFNVSAADLVVVIVAEDRFKNSFVESKGELNVQMKILVIAASLFGHNLQSRTQQRARQGAVVHYSWIWWLLMWHGKRRDGIKKWQKERIRTQKET